VRSTRADGSLRDRFCPKGVQTMINPHSLGATVKPEARPMSTSVSDPRVPSQRTPGTRLLEPALTSETSPKTSQSGWRDSNPRPLRPESEHAAVSPGPTLRVSFEAASRLG
jgi:hypothetical protein